MTPTTEQQSIYDIALSSSENLMIEALAGTGKTSTLEALARILPIQPQLYLVFNKRNAEEATRRLPEGTKVLTFNSLGHRVWTTTCAHRLSLNVKKIYEIISAMSSEMSPADSRDLWSRYEAIAEGVSLARALGYIPADHSRASHSLITIAQLNSALDEIPEDETSYYIDAVLLESIRRAYRGEIDFADQCYMPALFSGVFPKFPIVFVDEYQDLSPVQHVMVEKLCKTARQIGVGDDAQSIYAFRGARTGSMATAISQFSMRRLPLSVSFRCPETIVANVRWRVPAFTAFRPGGRVDHGAPSFTIPDNSAVICRNNAPLIRTALDLLSHSRPVSLAGVDIGKRVVKTMTKLGSDSFTQAQTIHAINEWLADREARGSKSARDLAACMRVFAHKAKTLSGAIAYAQHVFDQRGTIELLTGHKSKGLEFGHVCHLDPDLCSNDGQDPNVKYVIDTRSFDTLTYIRSPHVANEPD